MAEEDNIDNIVAFTGSTSLDIPPKKVLEAALSEDLEWAVVIGFREDGSLYLASSTGDLLEILGSLDLAKWSYLSNQEG